MLIVMNGRKVKKLGGQDRRWLKVASYFIEKYNIKVIINSSYFEIGRRTEIYTSNNFYVINEFSGKYLNYIRQMLAIFIMGFKEEHIHFAGNTLETLPSALMLKLIGRKISISFNGVSIFYLKNTKQWKSYYLLKIASMIADKIEVLNKTVIDENFFPKEKIFLSSAMYAGEPKVLGRVRKKKILFVGHLYLAKGIALLERIVNINELNEFEFHIYGDKTEKTSDAEREIIKRLQKKNNTFFHGHIDDVSNVYLDAVATLSLQTISNYPSQVVLESLVSGCAVAILDSGDSYRFGNSVGINYLPLEFNEKKYAEIIIKTINQSINHEKEISTLALEKFSIDKYIKNFLINIKRI